jgi:hypothetical protein
MTRTPKRHLPARTADEVAVQYAAGGEARKEAVAWFEGVVARAEAGDREAFRQTRTVSEAIPALLFTRGLHEVAEDAYLDVLAGKDRLVTRHMLRQQIEALRSWLAGASPSPLERLLVDRIVLCWLDSHHADVTLAGKVGQSLPIAQVEYHGRRAERAQRRYVEAIRTLATVRRLLQPMMQVNIGEQQVNVAGHVSSSALSPRDV